jgi:hypothetical protein
MWLVCTRRFKIVTYAGIGVTNDRKKFPHGKESDSTIWHRDSLLDGVAIGINPVSQPLHLLRKDRAKDPLESLSQTLK